MASAAQSAESGYCSLMADSTFVCRNQDAMTHLPEICARAFSSTGTQHSRINLAVEIRLRVAMSHRQP